MTLFASDNVLVPIDFSEEADRALNKALASFGDATTNIHVIHVLSSLEPTQPGMVWQTVDDQTRIDHIKALFHEKFAGQAYERIKFTVKIGNPSSEIIDYAEANAIDLIVISSRGRTGLSRFFLGSVAERVVRFARCPVLVLRH
ncbi:universal stress protein [Nodosilinea sp. LEGE 06152]|uniref:universal stress protein n=1 Tax=Nodosilinea sp. LEGE 06152 TaxID=2777966 RepID=UPI0018800412|nr:universal stress protein [Nodosilinea sp. LEGE 06152]MBE9157657.1 universal stress protein [Nodosilinea sp. LEGE 06152]